MVSTVDSNYMKTFTLIGGVSGVGKTSLLGVLRAMRTDLGITFDENCSGESVADRIKAAFADGINVSYATPLHGDYPKRLCREAKELGYMVRLYYIGLDTTSECVHRLKHRSGNGDITNALWELQEQFEQRFSDIGAVLPFCDEAKFLDNNNGFRFVGRYGNSQIQFVGDHTPAWLQQLSKINC